MIHNYNHTLSKVFFFTGTLFFISFGVFIFIDKFSDYIPKSWKQVFEDKQFNTFYLKQITVYKNDFYDSKAAQQLQTERYEHEYFNETDLYSEGRIEFRNMKDHIVYLSFDHIAPMSRLKPITTSFFENEMTLPADVLNDDFECIVYHKDKVVTRFKNINFKKMLTDKSGFQKNSFKMTSVDGKVMWYLFTENTLTPIID